VQTAQFALQGFLRAFAQFKLDEMMAWWADDATAFFPAEHQHQRLNGKAAVRAAFGQLIDRLRAAGTTQLAIVAEDLREQGPGDVSVISFHLRGEPLCRRTFVLQHRAGEWRIVHLHASNVSSNLIDE
jgi:ketosteroid isomerase-like protein